MKRSVLLLSMGLIVLGLLSFTYYVDVDGGDADLSGHLQTALDAWKSLDETLTFEEATDAKGAEALIRYGNEALFGPDTYSLTLKTSDETKQTQVLIKPSARDNQRILRHEVGLLLGLNTAPTGIMNPAITAEDTIDLVEADANQLEATVNAVKEDLNRDGKVDFYDLFEFSKLYGSNDISSPADLNEDGTVDKADLDLLKAAYTFSVPSETPPTDPESSTSFGEALPPAQGDSSETVDPTNPDATNPDPSQENPSQEVNPDTPQGETGSGETQNPEPPADDRDPNNP